MVQFEELLLELQALKPDIDDLSDALGLNAVRSEIEQLELKATEPGFWDDVERSQQVLQKTGALKGKVEAYENLVSKYDDTHALIELANEEEDLSLLDEAQSEYEAVKAELEKQRSAAGKQSSTAASQSEGGEEAELREQINYQESRRDALLVEYTQKSDFIRQADKSLEKYPDILAETSQLYDQKQRAQNTLFMLKRTIQLITRAKENLANRYLGKVERLFNSN